MNGIKINILQKIYIKKIEIINTQESSNINFLLKLNILCNQTLHEDEEEKNEYQ